MTMIKAAVIKATLMSLPAGAAGVVTCEPATVELGPEFRFVPQTKQNDWCCARAAPHWLQTTGIWLSEAFTGAS
jgi:hypothetical protein